MLKFSHLLSTCLAFFSVVAIWLNLSTIDHANV
jgi:hypothetical protein